MHDRPKFRPIHAPRGNAARGTRIEEPRIMIGSIVRNLASIFGGGAMTYIVMSSSPPPTPPVKEIIIREQVPAPPAPPPKVVDVTNFERAFDGSSSRGRAECRDLYALHGVAALSPTWRILGHDYVDQVLENQAELMRSARIVPVQRDGHVTGVKLFGIKKGDMMSTLGFLNGDELEDVNGFDITAPDKALEAYARLRTADVIEAGILRNGVYMRLYYVIC
jgi:general secretion pathway protein C